MNNEKKFSHITTIVISILLVIMVCLCAIFMFSFESSDMYDLSKNDVIIIKSGNARVAYSKNFNDSYVLPDKICICSSIVDDMVLIGFESQMHTLYDKIKPLFENFFIEKNLVTKLNQNDGRSSYLYSLASNGIMVVWDNPIPLSAIYYFSLPNSINDEISDIIVKKMYFYGEYNSYTCVLIDGNDDYWIYRNAFDDSTTNPYYDMLSNISSVGMVSFKFGYECKELSNVFNSLQDDAIITEEIQLSSAMSIRTSRDEIVNNSSLFENLDVNIVKATSYVSEDDTLVYMQEGKSIYIDDSGNVTYSVEGSNGLYLSDLINLKDNYDLKDYLGACIVLNNRMKIDYGDASLYLKNVSIKDGHITIRFGLRYENINIQMYNNSNIMSFEFIDNYLKHIEFYCMNIKGTYEYSKIKQYDTLVKSSLMSDNVNLGIIYNILDEQTISLPKWVNIISKTRRDINE